MSLLQQSNPFLFERNENGEECRVFTCVTKLTQMTSFIRLMGKEEMAVQVEIS